MYIASEKAETTIVAVIYSLLGDMLTSEIGVNDRRSSVVRE